MSTTLDPRRRPAVADRDRNEPDLEPPRREEIAGLARRGVAWSLGLTCVRQVTTVATTIILTRLLSPDDYGLMGMVGTLTALLQTLANGGLSAATIQRRDLSIAQVHNLFWVNAATGLLLWGVCIAFARDFAAFYGRDELRLVTVAMGASFAIGGLAVQPAALLARRMRFGALAWAEIGAQLVCTPVAIALAWAGWGYWAIVGQALSAQAARLAFLTALARYRPGLPRSGTGTWALLRFGACLSLNWVVIYFARNLDNVLVGRAWGAIELGYYSRAYFLMGLPTLLALGAFDGVMVPTLAPLAGEPGRLGDAYRRALRWVAFASVPLAAGLAVTAPEAIRLVYGPRWLPIVPMLTWLSIGAVAYPVYSTIGWLYIASRAGRRYTLWTVASTAILAAGFAAGLPWGALGVAVAFGVLMTFVLTVPALYFAHRAAGIEIGPTVALLAPIYLAAGLMAAASWVAGLGLEAAGVDWRWRLAGKIVVGACIYLFAIGHLSRPLMAELRQAARKILARLGTGRGVEP